MKTILGKISLKCRLCKARLSSRIAFGVAEAGSEMAVLLSAGLSSSLERRARHLATSAERTYRMTEKQPEKKEYTKPTLEKRQKLVEVTEGEQQAVVT